MAQLSLPKESKPVKGKLFDVSESKNDSIEFKIYRWDPEVGGRPRYDTYRLDKPSIGGTMVLDALLYIKNNVDPSITFRRSCREGICGSCAMNVNGENMLVCIKSIDDVPDSKKGLRISPLPHMKVIKDLVPNLEDAYKQYAEIEPWMKSPPAAKGARERIQSAEDADALNGKDGRGPSACVLCFCCSTACPSYWWNSDKFFGPATIMQAWRWIRDTRDESTKERLEQLNDEFKLYRCHTIMNCTQTCPKGLNPAEAVANVKKAIATNKSN